LRVSSASSAVSIVGLRAKVNERGEYLITTVPVTNEATPPAAGSLVFPHFADGEGLVRSLFCSAGVPGRVRRES
jgi:hypothetical protein